MVDTQIRRGEGMARISTVIACAHSPFVFQPPDWWTTVAAKRNFAPHAARDTEAQNVEKKARIDAAFARLQEIFRESRTDVVVLFGDDQEEQFSFSNHPAFAVYVGNDFHGYPGIGYTGTPYARVWKPKCRSGKGSSNQPAPAWKWPPRYPARPDCRKMPSARP